MKNKIQFLCLLFTIILSCFFVDISDFVKSVLSTKNLRTTAQVCLPIFSLANNLLQYKALVLSCVEMITVGVVRCSSSRQDAGPGDQHETSRDSAATTRVHSPPSQHLTVCCRSRTQDGMEFHCVNDTTETIEF